MISISLCFFSYIADKFNRTLKFLRESRRSDQNRNLAGVVFLYFGECCKAKNKKRIDFCLKTT